MFQQFDIHGHHPPLRWFRCQLCGQWEPFGPADREAAALAQLRADHPEGVDVADCVAVCDKCYKAGHPMRN